jgi:chromosome segregation ATPase
MTDLMSTSFKLPFQLINLINEQASANGLNKTETLIKILENHFNTKPRLQTIDITNAVVDSRMNMEVTRIEKLESERDMWKQGCELAEVKLRQTMAELIAIKKKDSILKIEETSLTRAYKEQQDKYARLEKYVKELHSRIKQYETPAVMEVYNYALHQPYLEQFIQNVPDIVNILAEEFLENHITNNRHETQF